GCGERDVSSAEHSHIFYSCLRVLELLELSKLSSQPVELRVLEVVGVGCVRFFPHRSAGRRRYGARKTRRMPLTCRRRVRRRQSVLCLLGLPCDESATRTIVCCVYAV